MKSFKNNEECYVKIGGEKRGGYIQNVHPNNTYDVKPFGRYAAIEKLKANQIIKFGEKKIPAPHKTSWEKEIELTKTELEPTKELIEFAEIVSAKKDSLAKASLGIVIGSSNNKYKLKIVGKKELANSSCRTLRVSNGSLNMEVFEGWLKSKTTTPDFLYYLVIWGGIIGGNGILDDGQFFEKMLQADEKSIQHYLETGRGISNLLTGYKLLFAQQTNVHTNRARFEIVKLNITQKHPSFDLSKEIPLPTKSVISKHNLFGVGDKVIYQAKPKAKKQSMLIHYCNDDGTYDLRLDDGKIESEIIENVSVSRISKIEAKGKRNRAKFVVDEIVLYKFKGIFAQQATVVEVNADNTYELKVAGAGAKLVHNVSMSEILKCEHPVDYAKTKKENLTKLK